MIPGVFIIALIIIILLAALPYIFNRIFKTRNFMGYDIGLCSSFFTLVAIFGVFVFGFFLFLVFFNRASNTIIFFIIFIIFTNIILFLFIFNYTKGISNPNQPYYSVFMFIAGYLLPPFASIYLYYLLVSLGDEKRISNYYLSPLKDITLGILILHELFFLFNMMQLAGNIILSMLHHRKVNKNIFYILIGCYIIYFLSFLIEFFISNIFLLILNLIINLAPFGFGVFFYCKYANYEYPDSGLLEPIN